MPNTIWPDLISRVEGLLTEARQQGVLGLTWQDLVARTDGVLKKFNAIRGLMYHPRTARVHRESDNAAIYYLWEDCPYKVDLSKDEILARVGATAFEARFCQYLQKFMGERAPGGKGHEKQSQMMAQASEHDCRKAYGMIGPLDDPVAVAEKREQARIRLLEGIKGASAQPARSGGVEAPVASTSPGPPQGFLLISKDDEEGQLRECGGRRAEMAAVYDWVANNLDNRHATPRGAPSNYAWSLLKQAAENPLRRHQFFMQYQNMQLKQKDDRAERRERDDDQRQKFRLLAMTDQALERTCPS